MKTLLVLALFLLAACGHEGGHGSIPPSISCQPGPDAQTQSMTATVVSEHCN